jgi:hypothetical protein
MQCGGQHAEWLTPKQPELRCKQQQLNKLATCTTNMDASSPHLCSSAISALTD